MTKPDFIGLGVEKSGTSWIFACLYEHPEICIPVKEVNFFCIDDKWEKGISWYTDFFKTRCPKEKIKGEFSTSYFYDKKVPARIQSFYPDIKLIVCLRNPIDRAYSNYINDLKAGNISTQLTFEAALKIKHEYLNQGKYKEQLERYQSLFNIKNLKIVLYDDLIKDPRKFIQEIYSFLEVASTFVPPSLHERINTARVPSHLGIEQASNRIAALLQHSKLGEKIWWIIKKSKAPKWIRKFNTKNNLKIQITAKDYNELINFFTDDIIYVEQLLNRKLDWSIEKK